MLAAVDAGRSWTKYVGPNGVAGKFPSWIHPYYETEMEILYTRDDMAIEYQGEHWYIGEVVDRVIDAGDRQQKQAEKGTKNTVLFILTALWRMGANDCDPIQLVTGLPLPLYKDGRTRETLRQALEGTHTIKITTGQGEDIRTFLIEKIHFAAEGAGAFYSRPQNGLIHVLDIGSRTINAPVFKDKRFHAGLSFSFNWGWDTLKDQNKNADYVARQIDGEVASKWGRDAEILVAGGMAAQVAAALQRIGYKNAVALPDAQMANAYGLYRMLEVAVKGR